MSEEVLKAVGAIVLIIAMILSMALLMAFPTKWLWNWLMTDLFSLQSITFWQALGLNILTGLFFRSTNTVTKK